MKFSKEDIQRVTKTSPIEDSLLVFQADGAKRKYVEYALVKIDEVILHVSDISRWIDAVPRFRDCYIYENNQPVQIRLKSAFYPVQIIELEGEQSMKSVMGQLTNLVPVIDVQSPPLFEVVAFHSGSDTYLGLAYHHLLLDGISAQLALSMLDPNHRFQASDWLPNPAPAKSDVPHLPSFLIEPLLPPPVAQAPGFLRLQHRIEGGSYEEVMIQWVDFIQQASGSDEVVVGEVLSARDDSVEAQQALGYFVQTWPLVFQGATHLEQLKSIRNERIAVSQDWVNRHVPSQCFDHVWVVEPTLGSRHESLFWSTPHYPLTLVIKPSEAHVDIEFCWNLEKVDARAAQQIFASFGAHLEEPEAVQSLPEWPAPSSPNLLALWDLSVAAHADRVAVEDAQGNQWTYRELDRRAEALASRLPVNPGDRIGVHVTHSAAIPLAFLGVLKRGGTYVPIDPTVTRERWEYILEDAGIELVVSDLSDSLGRVAVHPNERVDADMVPYEAHVPDPTEAVYLIYTSGTTGQPKGCAVNHLNLANLFEGTQEYFGFHPKDRWVLAHSYGFDFSTWEIWGCLLSGGQLFIPPRKTIQDTFSFYDYLKEEGITILNQTPKAFDNLMLVDESSTGLPSIRHVVFGGDKLHPERLSDWIARHKACVLTNMYGITETTVHVTAKQVVQETQSNIGRPLPGYTLRWVNDSGQAIPKGFIGEMHVFGNGVCNGYHGKPELTNEKFGLQHSNRFYRTGDLGWQVGEDAYYLGRKDRQIKVRGYRIELGEIEFQLQKSAPGCQFIAALHEDQLVAFFKGNTPGFDPEFFQGKLADYAIPHRFIHVTEFPLNASGKVDEKTLFAHLSERTTAASAAQGDPFIVQAVQETLGDGISMERTFIQNGGDSIAAIRVINKLRKAERTLQVSELFETHAIAQLRSAPLVADSKSMQSALELFHKKAALDWSDDQFYIPLLEAQEGILFDCLRSDDPSLYVEQLTYELPGTYGFDQIQKAYQAVCHHNPILTARLDRHVGQYLLKADRNAPVVCTEITSSEWKDYLQEDFARGFELERNLTRIAVLPGKDQTRLVWTHHHLILDGWSLGVFSNEMMKALENKTLLAHDEFIQLACECSNHPQAGTYWARKSLPQLATALPPPLPSKDPELAYLKHRVFIPLADASRIQETGTSMHAYCMTLWASFLCTLYDRSEVLLGNVVSLRSDEHLEALGMFVRTLPFIFHADRNRSFEQLLQDTAERLREDEQHKGERLGEHTQGHLNDHLFVFENYPVDHAALEEKGIRIGDFQERTGSPWTTLVYPVPGGVEWHVLFHPAHHNRNQVQSVLTHFERWAQALNWTQPCTVLKSALLLEPAIIGRTLPRQELKILELLKRDSNQPAILGTDFDMTYSDLWAEAELLANSLCQAGLEAREAVGIDVACTRHFAASILGVWRAGGVPAPVDKRYPRLEKSICVRSRLCKVRTPNGCK